MKKIVKIVKKVAIILLVFSLLPGTQLAALALPPETFSISGELIMPASVGEPDEPFDVNVFVALREWGAGPFTTTIDSETIEVEDTGAYAYSFDVPYLEASEVYYIGYEIVGWEESEALHSTYKETGFYYCSDDTVPAAVAFPDASYLVNPDTETGYSGVDLAIRPLYGDYPDADNGSISGTLYLPVGVAAGPGGLTFTVAVGRRIAGGPPFEEAVNGVAIMVPEGEDHADYTVSVPDLYGDWVYLVSYSGLGNHYGTAFYHNDGGEAGVSDFPGATHIEPGSGEDIENIDLYIPEEMSISGALQFPDRPGSIDPAPASVTVFVSTGPAFYVDYLESDTIPIDPDVRSYDYSFEVPYLEEGETYCLGYVIEGWAEDLDLQKTYKKTGYWQSAGVTGAFPDAATAINRNKVYREMDLAVRPAFVDYPDEGNGSISGTLYLPEGVTVGPEGLTFNVAVGRRIAGGPPFEESVNWLDITVLEDEDQAEYTVNVPDLYGDWVYVVCYEGIGNDYGIAFYSNDGGEAGVSDFPGAAYIEPGSGEDIENIDLYIPEEMSISGSLQLPGYLTLDPAPTSVTVFVSTGPAEQFYVDSVTIPIDPAVRSYDYSFGVPYLEEGEAYCLGYEIDGWDESTDLQKAYRQNGYLLPNGNTGAFPDAASTISQNKVYREMDLAVRARYDVGAPEIVTISGTFYLPEGAMAGEGGYPITIEGEKCLKYGTPYPEPVMGDDFTVPAGQNSVDYAIVLPDQNPNADWVYAVRYIDWARDYGGGFYYLDDADGDGIRDEGEREYVSRFAATFVYIPVPRPDSPKTVTGIDIYAATAVDFEAAAQGAQSLGIGYASGDTADSITKNVSLPQTAGNLEVRWVTSDENVIAIDGNVGRVSRPSYSEGDADEILTAYIFYNDVVDGKRFPVTVLKRERQSSGDGGGGGGGGTVVPPPATGGVQTGENGVTATVTTTATADANGNASASVTGQQVSDAISRAKAGAEQQGEGTRTNVVIQVDLPSDAKTVAATIPKASVGEMASQGVNAFTVSSSIADITFDADTLSALSQAAPGDIEISAAKVDKETLPEGVRQAVGDRPVFDFEVRSGDETISEFSGTVSVSVPYTLGADEDPNAIVIYQINRYGQLEIISNCVYDPQTGTITFRTDHFSQYAVGYNKVSFSDVAESAWYHDAACFIAARDITQGTDGGNFSPEAALTRGQFLVMTMRAYGIEPDENPADNFTDAGSTYYTNYLAAAKRLKISEGVGGNLYAPNQSITRQEMFTLLYNVLEQADQLPQSKVVKTTADFNDSGQIADWAKEAMTLFVSAGIIDGSGGKLSPAGAANRAQMAQILFNLLSE